MSILLVLILLLGLSYAWFTLTLTGEKTNIIKVGKLSLILDDSMGEGITLENAVPTYIETALQETPYHFTVENNGTTEAYYSLSLKNTGTLTNRSLLNRFYYVLKKDGKIISFNQLGTIANSSLQNGVISPSSKSEYDLYIWYGANQINPLTQTYESQIELKVDQPKLQKISNLIAAYTCGGSEDCTRVDQDFTYFQQEYYSGKEKYVWYSGKLWVITGYDKDGNVKMVNVDSQTMIPWGTTSDYQGSYVETWLNEEFLPSLNNYQKLLVTDQVWNYSKTTGSCTSSIGTDKLVTSPVGLLNSWDIYQAGNLDDSFNSADLILSKTANSYLGNARADGNICIGGLAAFSWSSTSPDTPHFFGVAPAVVLKKDAVIISGAGTMEDPYRLREDENGKKNDLLNTRYAGEYVAFGEGYNSSYRISNVKDGKVQLISTLPLLETFLDKNDGDREYIYLFDTTKYNEETFEVIPQYPYQAGSGDLLHYSQDDSTNYPLGYFLNHSFLKPVNGYISSVDRTMILENQTWYTGTVRAGESYKNAKDNTKQVTATIALPSIGDMSSVFQMVDKNIAKIYAPNTNNNAGGLFLTNNGSHLYVDYGAPSISFYEDGDFINTCRPTFYLKNNVKIKSGSGTRLDPYVLTMG